MVVLMRPNALRIAWLAPWLAAGLGGCLNEPLTQDGTCETTTAFTCDTILAGNPNPDGGVTGTGLVAYSCSGTARPDDHPRYQDGWPSGTVCSVQGMPDASGNKAYCCTQDQTTCAFNPVAICPDPNNYGFQCRGPDRPEVLNPTMTCGNGVREDNYIDYCCQTAPRPPGCTEAKGACMAGLNGWQCMTGDLPKGEDFGSNESRADDYYFVCAVGMPAPNPAISTYCCFTPSPLQPGGSCISDPDPMITTQLPGCTPGRFAFSCSGREKPTDDYLPIVCDETKDPPVAGTDAQGYPATLYCCDFVLSM
jgi:hypothetical protein